MVVVVMKERPGRSGKGNGESRPPSRPALSGPVPNEEAEERAPTPSQGRAGEPAEERPQKRAPSEYEKRGGAGENAVLR